MTDAERDLLFQRARQAASPTEDHRRRVHAALARKLGAGAAVGVGMTAAKTAASATPVVGALTVAAVKGVVAGIAVLTVSTALSYVVPELRGNPLALRSPGSDAVEAASSGAPAAPLRHERDVAIAYAPAPDPSHEPPTFAAPSAAPPMSSDRALRPPSDGAATASPPPSHLVAVERRPGDPDEAPPVQDDLSTAAPSRVNPGAVPGNAGDTAAETFLMAEMQAALRDGDARRALALVNEHERRFPRSEWAAEREGAQTLARCAGAGGGDAARIGRGFLERHPQSPLAGRVRATCRLETEGR